MPDELVIDFQSGHQPLHRPMSTADAAALATAQAVSQAQAQTDQTRVLAIRAILVAYMANATPTGADTVVALRNVIKALARDL